MLYTWADLYRINILANPKGSRVPNENVPIHICDTTPLDLDISNAGDISVHLHCMLWKEKAEN